MRTKDQGLTWDSFVTIEPYSNSTTHGVSAYGSVTARPDGTRIFALWIDNTENIDHLPGGTPNSHFRADMLGQFVWKYSDDQGLHVSIAPLPSVSSSYFLQLLSHCSYFAAVVATALCHP